MQDPDVFWHLKTGEWIWEHKALPERDPFSFSVDESLYTQSRRPHAILKGYWFAQLIIYGFFSLFGMYGLILFRVLIYSALAVMLFRRMQKEKVPLILIFFFLLPTLFLAYIYAGERPNIISYLCAVALFSTLDDFRQHQDKRGYLLPLIMLAWSLMHGGFLLGMVIIGIYCMVTIGRIIRAWSWTRSDMVVVGVQVSALILPFLINPTARDTVIMMIEMQGKTGTLYASSIVGAASPFQGITNNIDLFAVLFFAGIFFVVITGRMALEQLITGLFLFGLSLTSIRYMPFPVILMTPLIAKHWSTRPGFGLRDPFIRIPVYVATLFASICMIFMGAKNSFFLKGPVHDYYPADAVQFILDTGPQGNVFNDYTAGGYLLFGLYPAKKVFIDPRGLSLPVFFQSSDVVRGLRKGDSDVTPVWKNILASYRIDIVIIPTYNVSRGKAIPFVRRLIEDPDWELVFMSRINPYLIFLRRSSGNDGVIRRYGMDKKLIYEKTIDDFENNELLKGKWGTDVQIGLLRILQKNYGEAMRSFERAVEQNNSLRDEAVGLVLEELRKGRYDISEDMIDPLYNIK